MPNAHNHFYVTLFSTASQDLFPDNTHGAFTTELAKSIDLDSNYRWEVGVTEFTCPPPAVGNIKPVVVVGDTNAIIYCNLIEQQFVGDKLIRCLRTFINPSQYCEHKFDTIYYVPVENLHIRHIRIEIRDLAGKLINYKNNNTPIKLVLYFRRIPHI
jgi:hypothetical protein